MPESCASPNRAKLADKVVDWPSIALVTETGRHEQLDLIASAQHLTLAVFETVEELLEAGPEPHSILVLWIEEPVTAVVATIAPLREALGQVPAVMICSDIRGWELRAALAAGAAGVVLESEMEEALGPCLEAARAGQICVPRQHGQQVEPPSLSSREKQILGLVVMGHTNSQIADQLYLAESTVKSHLSSAFGKLGVRSRNEAVDLILDSERGLGMGILALGGEPLEPVSASSSIMSD